MKYKEIFLMISLVNKKLISPINKRLFSQEDKNKMNWNNKLIYNL